MLMKIKEKEAGAFAIHLEGYFEPEDAAPLHKALKLLFQKNPEQIILDFSGVDYIDYAGIEVLQEARQRTQDQNIRFSLGNVSPALEAAFDFAKVKENFEFIRTD
jgi:anti-anti-sigma factor